MRKGTKIVLFTGLGIFVTGLIICIIALALNGFRLFNIHPDSASAGQQETITVFAPLEQDFSSITVECAACDVEIRKVGPGNPRIDITHTKTSEDLEYQINVENETLIIRSQDTGRFVNWLDLTKLWDRLNNLITRGSVDQKDRIVLYLADKEYQQLNISVATGDITTDPDFVFKAANIATVTGDIAISQMKELVTLNVATTTGDIRLADMGIGSSMSVAAVTGDLSFKNMIIRDHADISVTTGDISLSDVQGSSITISSTTGDINLTSVMADALTASTTSGDITGQISADINVNGKSTSGDVMVPSGTKGNWTVESVSGDVILEGIN